MPLGPVEYMVVSFPGSKFRGAIVPAIAELVDAGIVRVIDLAFVAKAEDGSIATFELDEPEPAAGDAVGKLRAVIGELVNEDDILAVGELLEPGNSAALIVWEDLWAKKLADAIRGAGGEVLDIERVPHDVVVAAVEATDVDFE